MSELFEQMQIQIRRVSPDRQLLVCRYWALWCGRQAQALSNTCWRCGKGHQVVVTAAAQCLERINVYLADPAAEARVALVHARWAAYSASRQNLQPCSLFARAALLAANTALSGTVDTEGDAAQVAETTTDMVRMMARAGHWSEEVRDQAVAQVARWEVQALRELVEFETRGAGVVALEAFLPSLPLESAPVAIEASHA